MTTQFQTCSDASTGEAIVENIVIPNAAPFVAYLSQRPLVDGSNSFTLECDDPNTSFKILNYNDTLTAGAVGLDKVTARIKSTSLYAGKTLTATYTGVGTPVRAETINKIQTAINQAETDVDNLEGRMSTAEGDIDNVELRMESAETDINVVEGRMDIAESDITAVELRMTTTENFANAVEGRVTTAEGDIDTLETNVGTAQGDITALETAVDNLQIAITAAQSLIDTINASYVSCPTSSTDNGIVTFDGNTGKLVQNTTVSLVTSDHINYSLSHDPSGEFKIVSGPDTSFTFEEGGFTMILANTTGLSVTYDHASFGVTNTSNYVEIDYNSNMTILHGNTCITGTLQALDSTTATPTEMVIRGGNNSGTEDGGDITIQAGTPGLGSRYGKAQLKSGDVTFETKNEIASAAFRWQYLSSDIMSLTNLGGLQILSTQPTTANLPPVVMDANGYLKKKTDGYTGTFFDFYGNVVTVVNGIITSANVPE